METTRPVDLPAIRIEAENEWAWCGERRLDLSPQVFPLLQYLVEHPNRLITKDEIFAVLCGDTGHQSAPRAGGWGGQRPSNVRDRAFGQLPRLWRLQPVCLDDREEVRQHLMSFLLAPCGEGTTPILVFHHVEV
jgi:hypothetical protein